MKKTPLRVAINNRLKIVFVVSMLMALMLTASGLFAQKRADVLVIPKGTTYEMKEDTLVVEELRLLDSARLVMVGNSLMRYIKARRIVIGTASTIDGQGERGTSGTPGKNGAPSKGVCQNGLDGMAGTNGTNGTDGKSLTLEADAIEVSGAFHIYLKGGTGGDGGAGGNGSAGSPSSKHCTSHGGTGGTGGGGGNGGNGGTLNVTYKSGLSLNDFCLKAILHNEGGYQGFGGAGGKGGAAGTGASESKSNQGAIGKKGLDGKKGIEGKPLFYSVVVASAAKSE
ncbi:MAG: hypothetical protein ACOYW3_12620 [Bacteroidota bacterium]